jgi:acetate kinase
MKKKMPLRDVERLLHLESGLLGVSSISHDMRAACSADPCAKFAVELLLYRLARAIGSLVAALQRT